MFDCKKDSVELVEFGRKVAAVDPVSLCDDELMETAVALEQSRSSIELASAKVLGELDSRGCTDAIHGSRTAPWVAAAAGVSPGSVRARMRIGARLRATLPVLAEAVSTGRLSFDHAKVLCAAMNPRVRDAVVELQDDVIALADACSFDHWAYDVRCLIALLDADGPEPDDPSRNTLSWGETLDGVTHVKATLTADLGLLVRSVIDRTADVIYQRYAADHEACPEIEIPSRSTLRALALGEILRVAEGALPGVAPTRAEVTLVLHGHRRSAEAEPEPEPEPEPEVDTGPSGMTPTRMPLAPELPQLSPTAVPSNCDLGRTTTDTAGCPVPASAAAMWACDPDLWAVIVDHLGLPLDVGHNRRLATAAQRHAVAARDGGCVFPGCDAPIAWTDTHHLRHWANGGATTIENLLRVVSAPPHRDPPSWLGHPSHLHRANLDPDADGANPVGPTRPPRPTRRRTRADPLSRMSRMPQGRGSRRSAWRCRR